MAPVESSGGDTILLRSFVNFVQVTYNDIVLVYL